MGPFNRSIEMLLGEGEWGGFRSGEDGGREGADGKSEREEWKEETSRESETVRLAIINHICCWRRPRILATRQALRLPLRPLSIFLYQLGHSFFPSPSAPPPLPSSPLRYTGCTGPQFFCAVRVHLVKTGRYDGE